MTLYVNIKQVFQITFKLDVKPAMLMRSSTLVLRRDIISLRIKH